MAITAEQWRRDPNIMGVAPDRSGYRAPNITTSFAPKTADELGQMDDRSIGDYERAVAREFADQATPQIYADYGLDANGRYVRRSQGGASGGIVGQAMQSRGGASGGIVGQAMQTAGQLQHPQTYQFNPATRTINADTETVEGRIGRIVSSDSPLMRQARSRAMMQMNERGLINSSLATGAAQSAVLDAALPIASADASAFQQASRDNQAATNLAGQFNADWSNRSLMTAFDDALQSARMRAANDMQQGNMRLQAELNAAQAERDNALQQGNMRLARELEERMARLNQEIAQENARVNNSLTQGNMRLQAQLEAAAREQASQLSLANENVLRTNAAAQQAMMNYSAQVAQILADPNIAAENKQGLIDKLYQQTQITLRAIGIVTNMDFGNLLNFSGGAPAPTPAPAPAPAPAPVPPPPQPDYLTSGTVGGGN